MASGNMYKRIINQTIIIIFLIMLGTLTLCNKSYAKDKFQLGKADETTKCGVVTIQSKSIGNSSYGRGNYYDITVQRDGIKEVVVTNAKAEYVTDGKKLYYVSIDRKSKNPDMNGYCSIHCINLNTKTDKIICKGDGLYLKGKAGKYLWAGIDTFEGDMYTININSGKKNKVGYDDYIQIYGNNVLISGMIYAGDVGNYLDINIMNVNGKVKYKIAEGVCAKKIGKRIYWLEYKENYNLGKVYFREHSCNLKGKKHRLESGWKKGYPKKWKKINTYSDCMD